MMRRNGRRNAQNHSTIHFAIKPPIIMRAQCAGEARQISHCKRKHRRPRIEWPFISLNGD
jgi:hypothetical protein